MRVPQGQRKFILRCEDYASLIFIAGNMSATDELSRAMAACQVDENRKF